MNNGRGSIMTIVANNSYRYNTEMEFWLLKNYRTEDLIARWGEIYDNARDDRSEDAAYFLADCMDVLYEKVLSLPEQDRNRVIDRANSDMNDYEKKHKRRIA